MNNALQEIKKILEKDYSLEKTDLRFIPEEEAKIFLEAIKNNEKIISKIDPFSVDYDKNELKKWQLIYLNLHDLYHQAIISQNLTELEIKATASILKEMVSFLEPLNLSKFYLAYLILGISSLKINHLLPYLISEKIILGEFVSVGGIETSIWGIKLKTQILHDVSNNIINKLQKDNYHSLVKKYKNFIFDII